MDVVLLLDISDEADRASNFRFDSGFSRIRSAAVTIIQDMNPCIGDGDIRVAIATFESEYRQVVSLSRDNNIADLQDAINRINIVSRSVGSIIF